MTSQTFFNAHAMLLAAGRGMRMRPLTDHTPKPLLAVNGQALMHWPLAALRRQGVERAVVNTEWLGEQIEAHFGDTPDGLPALAYSREGSDFGYALETAGGVVRALPLLAEVFWVLAGDVYMPDFGFERSALQRFANGTALAHLWLVPNPAHNPNGDFGIDPDGLASNGPGERLTFSTVGLYKRALFEAPWCDITSGNPQGSAAPLAPLLRKAIAAGRVSAERYGGAWTDVGTPERLAELNAR